MKTQNLANQRSELRREGRTYQGLIDFLEEVHADEAVDKSFKKGAAPMDVSAVSQHVAGGNDGACGEEEPRYSMAEWAQYVGTVEPGAAADPGLQGPLYPNDGNALDALGKGGRPGGKGGKAGSKGGLNLSGAYSRQPIQCRRCLGTGHPESVCSTAEGSTSTTV